MAFNAISGKQGSVQVGTASYAFKSWEIVIEEALPDVSNFNGGGFVQVVGGLTKGTINLAGPWDVGNMPLTVGNSYSFTLAVNNTVNIVVSAIVSNITIDDAVDDAARVKVTAQTNGSFTAGLS